MHFYQIFDPEVENNAADELRKNASCTAFSTQVYICLWVSL